MITKRKRTPHTLIKRGREMARRIFAAMLSGPLEKITRVIDSFKASPQKARNHTRKVFNALYGPSRFKHIGCDYRRRGEQLRFAAAHAYKPTAAIGR